MKDSLSALTLAASFWTELPSSSSSPLPDFNLSGYEFNLTFFFTV